MQFNFHTHNKSHLPYGMFNDDLLSGQMDIHFFSVGLHPWYINEYLMENDLIFWLEKLEQKLKTTNCIAFGECGLDKNIAINFELQKQWFLAQISLSEKYKKPLIIHCVKSFQELINIKKQLDPKQKWIIHGFNKKTEIANQLLKNDFYFSFGSSLLQKIELQEIFKKLPVTRIFLETDDSVVMIDDLYNKAAKIKNISLELLENIISENIKKVLKIDEKLVRTNRTIT